MTSAGSKPIFSAMFSSRKVTMLWCFVQAAMELKMESMNCFKTCEHIAVPQTNFGILWAHCISCVVLASPFLSQRATWVLFLLFRTVIISALSGCRLVENCDNTGE